MYRFYGEVTKLKDNKIKSKVEERILKEFQVYQNNHKENTDNT